MKTPQEMTRKDYAALGFKSGIEIHQQLRTQRKLFCRCPNTRYSPAYDAEIMRHMRPTLSELGEYDGTALMEFKTRKEIIYRISRHTVCTYEMDDTPPFMLNQEALDIALQVTMLLGCNLVSEVHIARKQYLDGSIPTGFQRTTILGVDGRIPFKGRTIGIRQLGLEEDACREVSDQGHVRTYLTDRLSIPLIETVTEAEMLEPSEVAEVAHLLRTLTRLTGRVKTGMGAARQDVNVSIRGGERVEIKGVSRIPAIPALCHYEALRQKALLDIRELLRKRGITKDSIAEQLQDVTAVVRRSHFTPLQQPLAAGNKAFAVRLPGFAGLLNFETGPNVRFVREFSGRVKVIACLDRMPNLVYSDSPEPTLASRLWERLLRDMGAGPEDIVVLVWGSERDARTAGREVVLRAREATVGVPNETRKSLKDGTTVFERILPGPDRMYPDTDLPPLPITAERMKRIRTSMGPRPWELIARYHELGVPEHLACDLLLDPHRDLLDELLALPGTNAKEAAVFFGQTLRSLRRSGIVLDKAAEERMVRLFGCFLERRFAREAFPDLALLVAREPAVEVADLVTRLVPQPLAREEIAAQVRSILTRSEWRRPGHPAREHLVAMKQVMETLRGRADGKDIADEVRKYQSAEGERHDR